MGRFQTEDSDTQSKKTSPTYASHQATQRLPVTSENYPVPHVESPAPTPDRISPVKEITRTSSVDLIIEKSEPQSDPVMQSDMLSPLLISSAKPFSRQRTDSADRYHHVSKPVRKVSAPVSAKYSVPKSEPKAVLPVDAIPCPPEFADGLSHLHANAQESEKKAPPKETIVIHKEMLSPIETAPPIPKRFNLKNGETLHSSGTESVIIPRAPVKGYSKPPVPIKRFDPYASLHDKSKNVSRQLPSKVENKETVKPQPILIPEVTSPIVQSEVTVKESLKQDEPKMNNQTALKETNKHDSGTPARRRDNHENQFKEVVHESLDETTLKSSAAKAANRIMQTSKTFKITPSKQAQRNHVSPPPKVDTSLKGNMNSVTLRNNEVSDNTTAKPSGASATSDKPPVIPLRSHEIETPAVPISVNKVEPKVSVETPKPTNKSTGNVVNSVFKPPVSAVIKKKEVPPTSQSVVKLSPMQAQRETFPAVNSAAKSPRTVQSESKPSLFGPRITKSSSSTNRGKSFTIDPSKFKRSSAQRPTTPASSGSYQVSYT